MKVTGAIEAIDEAVFLTRKGLLELERDHNFSFAMYFENEEPAGWYLGKPLSSPRPKGGTDWVWVNFSPASSKKRAKKDKNHIELHLNELPMTDYKQSWMMCCPKDHDFSVFE